MIYQMTNLPMVLLLLLMTVAWNQSTAKTQVGLKTNLLTWATTTPNIGLEAATGKHTSLQLFGAVNPWDFSNGKRVKCWVAQPEFRYWPCQAMNGHFFGVHLLGGEYNIRNVKLPFGTLPEQKQNRHYEGWFAGAGITYGYQWILSRHWNIEAEVGVGYAYSPYKLYGTCERCLEKNHRNYVGPTKLGLNVIYIF